MTKQLSLQRQKSLETCTQESSHCIQLNKIFRLTTKEIYESGDRKYQQIYGMCESQVMPVQTVTTYVKLVVQFHLLILALVGSVQSDTHPGLFTLVPTEESRAGPRASLGVWEKRRTACS
jgi:hypothetical protein